LDRRADPRVARAAEAVVAAASAVPRVRHDVAARAPFATRIGLSAFAAAAVRSGRTAIGAGLRVEGEIARADDGGACRDGDRSERGEQAPSHQNAPDIDRPAFWGPTAGMTRTAPDEGEDEGFAVRINTAPAATPTPPTMKPIVEIVPSVFAL